ncbi:MAG: peptidoglycan DD-metalloendopeptidase family protein [Oligoflexia bacterium]|nr:peptidoglycan DD-metalloendopeptidase family protein [Oligoflexia bacterium]
MINFGAFQFSPVIHINEPYEVYDFSSGYNPNREIKTRYGIGKYDEIRPDMYSEDFFKSGAEPRNIHMGIDIAAPVGTTVHAVFDGVILYTRNNFRKGDYGYTIITEHILSGTPIYCLYGHLAKESFQLSMDAKKIYSGDPIGYVGPKEENGGWNPHLHFQVSLKKPTECDMPGAVSLSQREEARKIYLDPRLILGPLY